MTVVKKPCKQHEVTCQQTLDLEARDRSSLLRTNTCFTLSTVLYVVRFGVLELCVVTGLGGERLPASHMKERHTHWSSRPTRPAIYLRRRGRTISCRERQQWAQVMTGGAMG